MECEYKVVNIVVDELTPDAGSVPPGVSHVVVDYEAGSYEGNGTAIAILREPTPDGVVAHMRGLGHCSCYGPWDDGWGGEGCSWDALTLPDLKMHLIGDDAGVVKMRTTVYGIMGIKEGEAPPSPEVK